MKLIIKQYLSSLRERDELDALLPDLLSQMGLNVFSRPRRGTRQDGVDVAAVGSLNNDGEKVYLFSIKAGDLTRSTWDGNTAQSLRPSLNEIIDAYIPNKLPQEHSEKDISICICIGGDIRENVRSHIEGFFKKETTNRISFEEWNGDKLADLIQNHLLSETLLPEDSRSLLRKSIALLDEPVASFSYFARLISVLENSAIENPEKKLTTVRQMSICLWILFAWARDIDNLEAAYLAAERTLLFSWNLTKGEFSNPNKEQNQNLEAFKSVLQTYYEIANAYITGRILPYVNIVDGISSAVRPLSKLDVNLKLFETLGRLSVFGLWALWGSKETNDAETSMEMAYLADNISQAIISLINNNQTLFLPIKDDQAIDVCLSALQLFGNDSQNHMNIINWLEEMVDRCKFGYEANELYPCTILDYVELINHPKKNDPNYRVEVTKGSILYPVLSLWAAILDGKSTFKKVSDMKAHNLQHCNFQLWFPDDASEEYIYTNKERHGTVLSDVPVDKSPEEMLSTLSSECNNIPYFETLSSVSMGFSPLILVACRHYRIPVPIQFTNIHQIQAEGDSNTPTSSN